MADLLQHNDPSNAASQDGVSVAMACYNGEKYLPEMLDSILAQSVLPREIICSDDCSTDGTVAVLERYAAHSTVPIRILRQPENVGYRENFYRAFDACTSDYVAYCDQDDYWMPHKLEVAADFLREDNIAMFLHPSILTDENLVNTGQVFRPRARAERYNFPFASAQTHGAGHQMVFTKDTRDMLLELARNIDFQRFRLAELLDDLLLFAASLVGGIRVTTEPLVKFRRHANTVSRREKSKLASGLRHRVSRRLSSAERQCRLSEDTCEALARCQFDSAIDADASERANRAFRDLARARVKFFREKTTLGRWAEFPRLGYCTMKARVDGRELLRDAAALFFAPPLIEAPSR